MAKKYDILIIGAGLCGSLLALRLGQRGYKVHLVEKRADLRKVPQDAGRSINLAFSDRGIRAMQLVGLAEEVEKLCIPMYGRMIHLPGQKPFLSRYSGRKHEYINSISRTELTALLIDAAEKHPDVKVSFNLACKSVKLKKNEAQFKEYDTGNKIIFKADIIIGADGAGSALRRSMYLNKTHLFSFSQNYLQHGYKELSIPPGVQGQWQIEKNALHIWPRGSNMLIALPNLDGSFTVTLFLPWDKSKYSFTALKKPEAVTQYFKTQFKDALAFMPKLEEEFFQNPTGALGTIKCTPWHTHGNNLLMGDAAHAIVPFYGQGMNASFEDVVVFDEILDKHEGNWPIIFEKYEEKRKTDTDAIADLALDNFNEMQSHTASALFQEKRRLEMAFESTFPDLYSSKYSLVTFNEHLPYAEAKKQGRAQDKAILNLLDDGKLDDALDIKTKLQRVREETAAILQDDELAQNPI